MRVICGLVAVSMLVVLAQPALAVCVNRGGAKTCTRDANTPKYANSMAAFAQGPLTENPSTNGPTTVLQPSGSTSAAWVLKPQSTADGATVLGDTTTAFFDCGSTVNC